LENFNNSENNIISVELAKVLGYWPTCGGAEYKNKLVVSWVLIWVDMFFGGKKKGGVHCNNKTYIHTQKPLRDRSHVIEV
jgi:hypothetical protein